MNLTTFGALPRGAIFFYRSRFYEKRLIGWLHGENERTVGARALRGPMMRDLSPDAPVWIEPGEADRQEYDRGRDEKRGRGWPSSTPAQP